ncbi:MAG: ribosomal protein S18-alanine N-acetyltransferase [Betaproteobacteria bacterium]|nr:ribosomal protein S18-alanine N-acetyltransferase [Betaproteobacteria bacterium]
MIAAPALPAPELFPLSLRDLPWLCELEARVNLSPWQERHFVDSLEAGHDAWGAEQGGKCLGFVLALHAPDASHLLNIAVFPEAQRRGLGAFLLRHAMMRAVRSGAGEMFLEARPSNSHALSFYQSFGFRQIGLRKGYYPADAGGLREDALIFRATIPVLEKA